MTRALVRHDRRVRAAAQQGKTVEHHDERAPLVRRHGYGERDPDAERDHDEEEHPPDTEEHVPPHHAARAFAD